MAPVHGKDTGLKLDNTAASLTDISTHLDNCDGLPGEVELADVSTFGDEGHTFVPGLENCQFTIAGPWDATLDAVFGAPSAWKTATRTFEYGPAGVGSGAVKYSGEAWIQSYAASSPVADKGTFTATFQVDGQVARGTFA